jgi:hypothetical protein
MAASPLRIEVGEGRQWVDFIEELGSRDVD